MTSTITPEDTGDIGALTGNMAPYIEGLRPMLRRPDASGEFPIITGTRPVGADELARLAATTLILPDGPALPPALRPAVTTVYGPSTEDRQKNYRGRHRAAWSPWRWALAGAAALLLGELAAVAFTLAASAVVR